jgi:uncharacterized protein
MHLTLHLTRACNMNCRYCYSPPQKQSPGMSLDIARQALALGAQLNPDSSCGIVFFGGEPLLQKNLIRQILDLADEMSAHKQGRFHFKMTTNGLLLDDEFLQLAVDRRIVIALSHDGLQQAHDAHRMSMSGTSTWPAVTANLQKLLKVKPYASVLSVINPDTVQYMSKSIEFLVSLGVRYLVLSLNYAADWSPSDLAELEKQYLRLARKYVQWTLEGKKFYLSPFEVKLASHIDPENHPVCDLGMRQLSVDPEGYLFPCIQFPRAGHDSPWQIGHVSTGINEPRRIAVNALASAEKALCAQCEIAPRCQNKCACLNWQTLGTLDNPSPILCAHEKLLTPIADRIGQILWNKQAPHFIQKHYNRCYPLLSLLEDTHAASFHE